MTFDPEKLREQLFGEDDSKDKADEKPSTKDKIPEEKIPDREKSQIPDPTKELEWLPRRNDSIWRATRQETVPGSQDIPSSPKIPGQSASEGGIRDLSESESKPVDDVWRMPEPKPEYAPENLIKPPSKSADLSRRISEGIANAGNEPYRQTYESPKTFGAAAKKVEQPSDAAKIGSTSGASKPAGSAAVRESPFVMPRPVGSKASEPEPAFANTDMGRKSQPLADRKAQQPAMQATTPDKRERNGTGGFGSLRKTLVDAADREENIKIAEKEPEPIEPTDNAKGIDESPKVKKRKVISPDKIKPPSPLTLLMLIGGGVSLVAATIGIAMGNSGTPVIGLGGIGFVLIALFALINRLWLKLALSSRSARYSTNVATVVATFLGILVFANILAYRHHMRFDLSSQSLNSLSPQTISVLEDINRAGEDIAVTAFIPPATDYREKVESLLNLYIYHSPHIRFTFVDPEIQRSLTEEKGITTSMAILFEFGANRSVQTDFDEPHITSGLIAVRQNFTKKVSFVTGHGEIDPLNTDDIGGLSEFKDKLELEGYEIDKIPISPSSGIPPEIGLLVIVNPQRPFRTPEVEAIARYLEGSGSLMCFLEPNVQTGLEPLLERYGITIDEGVILDDFENYNGEVKTPKIFVKKYDHPITRVLTDSLVFNIAGSLRDTSGAYDDTAVDVLLTSGASAWIEKSGDMSYTEGLESRGQKYVAILSTRAIDKDADVESVTSPAEPAEEIVDETGEVPAVEPADEPAEETDSEKPDSESPLDKYNVAQALVVSDASMILNGSSDMAYNFDFVMNSVNHMTELENLIGIRPATDINRSLDLSGMQMKAIFAVSVILTPLLIALLGGFVWWKRRS